MKLNAIIRIIVWSMIIVILTGILLAFTFGKGMLPKSRLFSDTPPAETAIPVPLNEAPAINAGQNVQATVIANAVNVRSEASSGSAVIGVVELNDTVFIREGKEVNGQKWLLISSPVSGWMKADFVDTIEDVIFYSADALYTAGETGTDSGVRSAAVSHETGIYPMPDETGTPIHPLSVGDTVTVSRQEAVNGTNWVYVTAPSAGWVMTDCLTLQEDAGKAQLLSINYNAKDISELDIDWVAGTIRVQSADVSDIRISETEVTDPKYTMHLKKSGRKLSIEFCEDDDFLDFGFGINFNESITKDLTILVPYSWTCESLDIDAASTELYCANLVIDEVDINGASGKCSFDSCQIQDLDVDTASGDILFTGTLNTLDCDAASAHVELYPENVPSRIDVDSMSGNLGLFLPPSAGFSLHMDSMSGDFISDFGFRETAKNTYTCGDGACKIDFSSMSGMVTINKGAAEAAAIAEVPTASNGHHHTDSCQTDPDSCPDNTSHHKDPHHD